MKIGPLPIPQVQIDPQTGKASAGKAGRFADHATPLDPSSPAAKGLTERLDEVDKLVASADERRTAAEEKRMAMHSQMAGVLEKMRDHLLATSQARSPQENSARLASLDKQLAEHARQFEESQRLVNELRNPAV